MAGPGLEDITLQDGYTKLLVSELSNGISTDMTKISTSVGASLAPSVLWLGQGDVDAAPHFKIKAASNSHRFFTITDGGGTAIDGVDEKDILVFTSDGSGGSAKQGRGTFYGKLQVDCNDRGRIEFTDGVTVASSDVVPTIKKRVSDGSIEFEMEAASSKYWKFDRLEISAGTTNANGAAFYAPGVDFTSGTITAEGLTMSSSAHLNHTGNQTTIANAGTCSIKSTSLLEVWGAGDTYIEAQELSGEGDGNSNVYIDALTDVASGTSPAVRIGSRPSTSRVGGEYGTKDVLIGDNARDDAELKLNSRKVSLDNSMLVLDIADGATWSDGWQKAAGASGWDGIGASQSSIYSIEDTGVVYSRFFDGKYDKNYNIEILEIGKAKTPYFEDIVATSTTPAAATSAHSVVQYVKNGASNAWMVWKFNNGAADVYHYFNLDSVAASQDIVYSASEPA